MATAGLLDLPSDVLLYLLNTIVAGQHCDKHKHTNLNVAAVLRLCGVSKRLLDYFKQRLKLEADRHLQIWSELALDKKGQQECLCFHIEDDRRLHRPMTDIYELRGERFAKVPKRSPPELDQVMRYSIGKTVEMLDHYSDMRQSSDHKPAGRLLMAFILAFEEDCGHPSLSALLKREEKLRAYKGKLKQVWAAKNGVPVEAPIDAKELLQGCSIQ